MSDLDKSMKKIKKYPKIAKIIIVTVILILIPLMVYGLSEVSVLPVCGSNDWAGFWGGYLGAILGGVITLLVMRFTLINEKEARNREEKINYFNQIVSVSAEFSQAVGKLCVHITRSQVYINNDIYDRTLETNNEAAKYSIELEILLETRKDSYDLDEIISYVKHFADMVNNMMNIYEKVACVRFENKQLCTQLEILQNEILHEDVKVMECMKETVRKNLF